MRDSPGATGNSFHLLAEQLPQLVWTADRSGEHDYFNRHWVDFTGLLPAESFGHRWLSAIHPDDAPRVRQCWHEAVATGGLYEAEARIRGKNGGYRWFLSRGRPVQDADGRISQWLGTCTDIDAQKRTEEFLRLRDAQNRLALEAAGLGTWHLSSASSVISVDARACELLGIEPAATCDLELEAALAPCHPEDRARVRDRIDSILAGSPDGRYEDEFRVITPDGSTRWLRAHGKSVVSGPEDAPRTIRLSGVLGDGTRLRAAEEARRLMTRELNHRVKNLFAVAGSMAGLTARYARTPREMAEALRGRFAALSRAHDLARPATIGAAESTAALGDLLRTILAPYDTRDMAERIVMTGPAVMLGSAATTSLALVLHEWATNAVKHGSLGVPDGRVTVRWTIEGDELALTWSESGGPPVAAAAGEGFGTALSRQSVVGQLGGVLKQDFEPAGLSIRMNVPIDRLGR